MTSRCYDDGFGATLELQEIDGVLYPYYNVDLPSQLSNIRDMHVRKDDVILCTYPKAGTHWMWEVLTMLVNRTSTYSHYMKRTAMLETVDLHLLQKEPSPRVLNTHLLPHALPEMTWSSGCHVVVCHRNPKDISVSLYNMARQLSRSSFRSAFEGTYHGYARLFLNGTAPHGSWFDYVRAWETKRRELPRNQVYVSSYEVMTREPVEETARLASFLGLNVPDSLCRDIAQACSFDNLKEACLQKVGAPTFWKPGSSGIFRKGKVGDWKNWMSDDLSAAFDNAVTSRLHDIDNDFIYEL
ncbi:sulfotransferase 1C2-like [Babylonia areolata]|uniref:sulfotransferase 1C2-like n=1 Tax=Babylonia areolata TaxID=304850 RepID=UPI003FD66A30